MKTLMKALLAVAAVTTLNYAPSASAFPDKEVSIVVGFAAGGLADQGARTWARYASPFLGRPVIVLNKPGFGGVIAANEVAKATPDGHTLSFFTPGPFVVQPHFGDVPYKVPDSFVPIITQYINPIIIASPSDAPYHSLRELIEFAKRNPGKVRYSSSGAAGIERFAIERLQQVAGFQLTIIPFKASSEATTALLGKHVELTTAYLPDLKRHFDAGTLRAIVSLGFERNDLPLGNIATAREAGYDVVGITYSGLLAPQGTPQAVINQLHDAFKQAQDTPEFKESMERLGIRVRYMNGQAFLQQIKLDYETNGRLIKALGIK